MELGEYARNYELERNHWWFVGVRAMANRLLDIAGGTDRQGDVLDVGCGTGAMLDELSRRFSRAVGADVSSEALRFCAQRGQQNLVLCDATAIGLADETFDRITAIGVIEHVDDDQALLREMHRLLKPGGVLVLLTSAFPQLWSMHDEANHHRRRYVMRALERDVNAHGLETIRLSHFNFFLFVVLAPMLLIHRVVFGLGGNNPRRLLPTPPRLLNAALTRILVLEAQLMSRVSLPWGVSMIGAFRKTRRSA